MKIEIKGPIPPPEDVKAVFDNFYEDCGIFYLMESNSRWVKNRSCMLKTFLHLEENENISFPSSFGKAVLEGHIQERIFGFHEEQIVLEILNGKNERNSKIPDLLLVRTKRMKIEFLAAAHFLEEMHNTFEKEGKNPSLYGKFLAEIPLLRLKVAENMDAYIHPTEYIKKEPFDDQEWVKIFKCYVSRVVGWLDEQDPSKESSKALFQRIYDDYIESEYFDAVYYRDVFSGRFLQ
jgi:hypothetical protein